MSEHNKLCALNNTFGVAATMMSDKRQAHENFLEPPFFLAICRP